MPSLFPQKKKLPAECVLAAFTNFWQSRLKTVERGALERPRHIGVIKRKRRRAITHFGLHVVLPEKNNSRFIEKLRVRGAREMGLSLSRRCKRGVGVLKNSRLDGSPDFLKVGPIFLRPWQNMFRNYAARNANLARLVAPAIIGYNAHPHAFERQLDQAPVTHKS